MNERLWKRNTIIPSNEIIIIFSEYEIDKKKVK